MENSVSIIINCVSKDLKKDPALGKNPALIISVIIYAESGSTQFDDFRNYF